MRPDGAIVSAKTTDVGGSAQAPVAKPNMLELFKDHNFRMIVLTFSLMFCCMSATLTHMIPRSNGLRFYPGRSVSRHVDVCRIRGGG